MINCLIRSPSINDVAAVNVEVVHAIPGRIRLRMLLRYDRPRMPELTARIEADPRVLSVRMNPACGSIAIQYRRQTLSAIAAPDYFLGLLAKLLKPGKAKDSPNRWDESARSESPQVHKRTPCSFDIEACVYVPAPEKCHTPADPEADGSDEGEWSSLRLPILATVLAIASQRWPHPLLKLTAAGVFSACVWPIAVRAQKSVWQDRQLNIDCLDLMAIALSTIQGKLITPALMMTLHGIGDVLREQTARSTAMQTADLLDAIGHFAWVIRNGQTIQIASDRVKPGETVLVYPGEQIPVDGTVTQGQATVDQQQLTGESMPIVAGVGTYVYASTLVRSGKLRLTAEKVGNQTRAAASLDLLSQAPVHDTRMANYAEKIAARLILPVLGLGAVVLMTTRDPARVAAIFTLDFVTGIRLSIPTAFLGALNHTTRHGILVRSGRTLEQLAQVDTIVFDKTGTLTQGDIQLSEVITVTDALPSDRLLQLAAAAEQRITHPVAEAIVRAAGERGLTIPPRQDWHYEVGSGVRAEIDGQTVLVGSRKFLQAEGIDLEPPTANGQRSTTDGVSKGGLRGDFVNSQQSGIYVACDGQFQGQLCYADPLRADSATLISRLRELGLEVHLLTGDSQLRAEAVAEELGIPSACVHGSAFPEEKARLIRDLHRAGKTVAFVGDGLNDSVALAYADVSVSFEDGSHVARETADVVLMNNDLGALLEAIAIAQDTEQLISQNTALVVAPNLLALGLAATVGLNPLVATVIHNGSAIAAGLNSLRPLLQHQLTA